MTAEHKKDLGAGLSELEAVLAEHAGTYLPKTKKITNLCRVDFQSSGFRKAGFHLESGRERETDNHLFIALFEDGTQLIVIDGKITNREKPYELMWQGADLRQRMVVTYQYDGKGSITETDFATGDSSMATGEYGKPETLLHYVKQALGTEITSETFK